MPTPATGRARASRAVILVEGPSDQVAVEILAARCGHDLDQSGVEVVAIGGATNLRQFIETYGPGGRGALLAGLGDIGEVAVYGRTLSRAGVSRGPSRHELEEAGFHMCVVDLEDELIRALGAVQTRSIVERADTPGSFRSYQRQPAHREQRLETQLRGFVTNWKIEYARLFVAELHLAQVPRPLAGVLDYVLS
ncbi:MAG: ATP-dependent endonuclease [Acidimicrobiia bacterium]